MASRREMRRPRPGWSRTLPPLLAGLVALVLLTGCGGDEPAVAGAQTAGRPGGGPPGGGAPSVPVAVAEVEIGDASSYYTATATLEAEHHAQLLARTTGVVREITREEGDRVKAGDLLLRIEDDEARQRLEQADANLAMARAEHDRRTRMRDGGLLSDEEFETTENTLRIREAERELAQLQLDYTRVRSPLDGRVVRRLVDLGQNVTPGTPLFEVMDVEPLLARVHIPAKRMGFVEVGQDITISLETTDETLHGRVSLVSPIVDPTTGTVKVTAEIDDYPETTRPGDFAQVSIVTARHQGTQLVPSIAVFEEQGQDVLYVVEDGKAVRRIVETGFVDGDLTEVVDGIAPEALVVVRGQRQLRDGADVEVLEGPPHVLAALAAAAPESVAEASAAADGATTDGGQAARQGT